MGLIAFVGNDLIQACMKRLGKYSVSKLDDNCALCRCSESKLTTLCCGSKLMWMTSLGCQYDDICKMAGPLKPRWVNKMFSWKEAPLQLTIASIATPEIPTNAIKSCGAKVRPTKAGRSDVTIRPNCLAIW